jgi:serine/threonine-protein kinase
MSHPNIIKVTDLIDEGDTVAFVMEHIDGETLKEYLDRKGKLRDEEIRHIFSQMLDAVGYVHTKGLVHRDIKPSNFMIDKEGVVKLLDFGIAKNTDVSSAEYTQTGTGMQMGTPMYMSPEQITETKSVTAQSDIYSLGVVLWQLVTGERPYNTATLSNFQLQTKIVNEALTATGTEFDFFIRKATEKETSKRYQNTNEFSNSMKTDKQKEASVENEKTQINVEEKTVFEKKEVTVQKEIKDEKQASITLKSSEQAKSPILFDIKNIVIAIGSVALLLGVIPLLLNQPWLGGVEKAPEPVEFADTTTIEAPPAVEYAADSTEFKK